MPAMAPLPTYRVSQNVPFSNVDLDYLGPIQVKLDSATRKRWVCLFTCTVTRALHLEMVHDLTSEEVLYALRRFISTIGTPCAIVSDNASQFKLSSNVIQSVWSQVMHDEDVQNFAFNTGIRWSFIIELSPWMGGFYERLVGLVKRSLRKTLKKKLLTDVQLQTVLKEVEAIINSRPLVYVGDDINSTITLTASHFLSLNPKVGIPEIDLDIKDPNYKRCESSSDKLLQLWKKGQRLLNSFWSIWREEYLVSLRERMQTKLKTSRIQSQYSPSVGEVVIIKENIPRGMWKLGKIIELIQSRDKEIRSARIKVASGNILGRPLNLLYPLEVDNGAEDNQSTTDMMNKNKRAPRRAAVIAKRKIKELCDSV